MHAGFIETAYEAIQGSPVFSEWSRRFLNAAIVIPDPRSLTIVLTPRPSEDICDVADTVREELPLLQREFNALGMAVEVSTQHCIGFGATTYSVYVKRVDHDSDRLPFISPTESASLNEEQASSSAARLLLLAAAVRSRGRAFTLSTQELSGHDNVGLLGDAAAAGWKHRYGFDQAKGGYYAFEPVESQCRQDESHAN